MRIDGPHSHSILWSSLFASALLIGCKEPPSEHTEEKAPERTKPGDGSATHDVPMLEHEKPASEREISVDDQKRAQSEINEGRQVAAAIDAAIQAIDAGHGADAKIQVAKALDGLAELERERPAVHVILELWRGKRAIEVFVEENLDTVPLLETLTRVDVPVRDREAIAARHELRKRQAVGSVSTKEKSVDLEIVDANLVREVVDLPIASTAIHVRAAEELLEQDDLAGAKRALLRAVSSVNVIDLVEEAPEYQAQKLVWAAETAFIRGDRPEARRLLALATDRLAPLAKNDKDAAGREMVTMLQDEIKPLQEALALDTTLPEHGFRRLAENARTFARRSVLREVMAARRETERLGLADALMWLEKARTDGVTEASGNAPASRDLVLAETALTSAIGQAPNSAKPRLDDIHARMAHLVKLDAAQSRSVEEIESELRGTTFELRMLMLDLGVAPWSQG